MNNIQYYQRENRLGRMADYALFNGIEFYKHGKYYVNSRYGQLHVYVYQEYNQISLNKIVMDKNNRDVVHHKDVNPYNNHISNLQCMTQSEHMSLHAKNKIVSDETKQKLSEANAGENNPMYGKAVYEVWVEKYGIEEADKRLVQTKKKMSAANKGKKHGSCKLSTENVNKIKDLYETENYTQSKLGKKFNVSQVQICNIVNGKQRING